MALNECPECHQDVSELTSEELRAHREDHWPGEFQFRREHPDAPKRADALDREVDQRKVAEIRKQVNVWPGDEK